MAVSIRGKLTGAVCTLGDGLVGLGVSGRVALQAATAKIETILTGLLIGRFLYGASAADTPRSARWRSSADRLAPTQGAA